MTFCEGFKVTDVKALAAAELDREGVMRAVTESFAYQVSTSEYEKGGGGGDAEMNINSPALIVSARRFPNLCQNLE